MSNVPPSPNPSPQGKPVFSDLSRDECERILARNHVGRLAFSFRDRVDIEPIHYVYSSQWFYGRTSPGAKLTTLAHHRWVAFEVDEVQSIFHWQSVVVHGAFYIVEPDTANKRNSVFLQAIDLLRTLIPETLTGDDPTSFRDVLFRIHLDEVHGRKARHPS